MESSVTVAPSSSGTATRATAATAGFHLQVLVTQAGVAQAAPAGPRMHSRPIENKVGLSRVLPWADLHVP